MTRGPNHGGRSPDQAKLLFMLNCYDVWSGPRADGERCAFPADQEETQ